MQERVIKIFEACNFQDLTGQRITKVVATLKFIETHIVRMMEIWGGLEAFKDIEAETIAEREGDASCSTARRSRAKPATPRRTTSTRCLPKAALGKHAPHVMRRWRPRLQSGVATRQGRVNRALFPAGSPAKSAPMSARAVISDFAITGPASA